MTQSPNKINSAFNIARNFALGVDGFTFADLHDAARLRALHETFLDELATEDAGLHARLTAYLAAGGARGAGLDDKAESELLLTAAPHLSAFVARLFHVADERRQLKIVVVSQDALWEFKTFVQRRASKIFNEMQVAEFNAAELTTALQNLRAALFPDTHRADEELALAWLTSRLLEAEKIEKPHGEVTNEARIVLDILLRNGARELLAQAGAHSGIDLLAPSAPNAHGIDLTLVKGALRLVEAWAALHLHNPAARARVKDWVSFKQPHALDYQNLVQIERPRADLPEFMRVPAVHLHRRSGFKLTDHGTDLRGAVYEADYCLHCHERDKDSCSKGFHEKDGAVKTNPLNVPLPGCPLNEKISEMHALKKVGDSLAALALITIDNPMLPGTGHRICNDCMKSCIFQKQEPVNIPLSETSILRDVLAWRYGYEIYALLTRWNPLNARRPYPLPYNGKQILVVGLGPAGYTLAHHLLNEGFGVVAIDGLKIEPLPPDLVGDEMLPPAPVNHIDDIWQDLDERILSGFGGVSEYGITVRWDKNFLTLLHLNLARRAHFKLYGGVRFGGTLDIEDAWALGFDHIALATGAGSPTIINIKNNLLRGIRQASDFLMALQLTGAFKTDLLSNLQVRLPAIVIGGGLTATDTATELSAYYPVQVENMLARHEELFQAFGAEKVFADMDAEERAVYDEFLEHGRAVRAERMRAAAANEKPDFVKLLHAWGGVTLVYRKRLQDAPAYRLNHEETQMALAEGAGFIENLTPVEAVADEHGAVAAMIFRRTNHVADGGLEEFVTLPARTVCVAAGTSPNVVYEKEYPGTFEMDARRQFFALYNAAQNGDGKFHLAPARDGSPAFFTSYNQDGKFITTYGDNHPAYAGNVVRAMASAKHGYRQISALFAATVDSAQRRSDEGYAARQSANSLPANDANDAEEFRRLVAALDKQLTAKIVSVERIAPQTLELIVHAPAQARKFRPGNFYRLQNYETHAPRAADGTRLMTEGIALAGAWADKAAGTLGFIIAERGASSRLCAQLRAGDAVTLMGPTGAASHIPRGAGSGVTINRNGGSEREAQTNNDGNETVLLIGGGAGNAALFATAHALRAAGNKVLYLAGYRRGADLAKRELIESAATQVIYATEDSEPITPQRAQDAHFRGNAIAALTAYARGELGAREIELTSVRRIIAAGSENFLRAVRDARQGELKDYLDPAHSGIASLYAPMQCMMKEICAQCVQRQIDPQTGAEVFVYSCAGQEQPLDAIDFDYLRGRLRANSLQEKLANLWLDKLRLNEQRSV